MTTKATTDKQTTNWPTILFETEYFPFEKKTGPTKIRTKNLCRPRHIGYLQALSWMFNLKKKVNNRSDQP